MFHSSVDKALRQGLITAVTSAAQIHCRESLIVIDCSSGQTLRQMCAAVVEADRCSCSYLLMEASGFRLCSTGPSRKTGPLPESILYYSALFSVSVTPGVQRSEVTH